MKTLNYLSAIVLSALAVSSCANLQQVADDDVYVTKNPALSSAEEVNDITSYENYRFHKTAKTYNSRYGQGAAIASGSRNGFYNLGYMYAFHPNYLMYGRPTCGQFGFNVYFYDSQFAYNNYGLYNTSFYNSGYPYYPYYGNPYFYNSTSYAYYGQNSSGSVNKHYGPRSFLSGVNNSGRGSSSSVVGMAKKNTSLVSSSTSMKGNSRTNTGAGNAGRNTSNITSTSIKNTRTISSGTTLSGTNRSVSSSSVNRNNNSATSSTRSSSGTSEAGTSGRSRIEVGTSSGSSGSGTAGGTTRNSGSSGTSASPRGGGSSGSPAPTRRGGR